MTLRRFPTGSDMTNESFMQSAFERAEQVQRIKQQTLIYGVASVVAFFVTMLIIRWLWLRREQIGATLIYAAGRVYRVKAAASHKASALADQIRESSKQ